MFTGTGKDSCWQRPWCPVLNCRWQWGILCKNDGAEKGWVWDKNSFLRLKEYNRSALQPIILKAPSQSERRCFRSMSSPFSIRWSKHKVSALLYRTLVWLMQMALGKRALVLVPDPKVLVTRWWHYSIKGHGLSQKAFPIQLSLRLWSMLPTLPRQALWGAP